MTNIAGRQQCTMVVSLALLMATLFTMLTTIQCAHRTNRSSDPVLVEESTRMEPPPPPPSSSSSEPAAASSVRLDRNMAIACTNRFNCERICAQAQAAKQVSKATLIDALIRQLGEATLTDAHKLGIQFGRHKSCEKCALIYSNCIDDLYRIARRQLFNWRQDDGPLMLVDKNGNPMISFVNSSKSSNRL